MPARAQDSFCGDELLTLTYYGHCAFLWTSAQGIRVLIDPFGNSESSYWFPRPFPPLEADVVLVTHDHFDHNATNRLPGRPTLLRGPGAFRLQDIQIEGVLDVHSAGPGARGMANTLFVIEMDGVRYCHIGDNRHDVPEDVRVRLGRVDVLMVTVDDSCHLLSYTQVDVLVDALDPRVVVPMHYYIEGLTTKGSTLKEPAVWLASRSLVRTPDPLVISARDLPETQQTWVLAPQSVL